MRTAVARIDGGSIRRAPRLSRQEAWLAGAAVLPLLLIGYSVVASALAGAADALLLIAAMPVMATAALVIRNLVRAAAHRAAPPERPLAGGRVRSAAARR